MADELRFSDVKLGDKIAGRYVLESVVNPDNGEAATFMCNYEGWICRGKIFYDDKLPSKEILEKQKGISSTHIVKKMDQNVFNGHIYQIMPNFNGNIMSKPVNDKKIIEIIIPGVLDALKSIHEAGIIHGYVKPNNIFYSPMGDAVLLGDFGVALENIGDCGKNIAMNYLPPEVQNGVYDEKADFYSLGVSLVQLATGKNPFEGLNKRNMIKAASTRNFDLPPKMSPKLRNIIMGLTVKDYNTRWGAAELEAALAGEEVEVVDNFVYVPPVNEFAFGGVKYADFASLAVAFTQDWNSACTAIRSPEFTEFVEGFDDETIERIKGLVADEDTDKALFTFLYDVNPELPFCWKGVSFPSFDAYAQAMKDAEDKEPYKQILSDGAMLMYMKVINADDDAVSVVARLTDDAQNGVSADVISHKLDYILSGEFTYSVDGIPFSSVDELIKYIEINVSEVKALCHEFIRDSRFFAWLSVLGYDEQVAQWRAEVGR